MTRDARFRELFGELRARFSRPPSRETFLQLCGYLVHLWARYGEQARELAPYASEGFLNFQQRVPSALSTDIVPEVLLDDPFMLHGGLLLKAIEHECEWLPSLRAFEFRDNKARLRSMLAHADCIAKLQPENLALSFGNPEEIEPLLDLLDCQQLATLRIRDARSPEGIELVWQQLERISGAELCALELSDSRINTREIMRMLDLTSCRNLTHLRVALLADDYEDDTITLEHASLERLIIERTWYGMSARAEYLLRGTYPALEHITFAGLWFSGEVWNRHIFEGCPSLKKLDLMQSSLWGAVDSSDHGPIARMLAEGVFARLEHLSIQHSMDDPAAIGILLRSGQLENLRYLDLKGNHLDADSARALLEHDGLPHLEYLDLGLSRIPEAMQTTLEERFAGATVLF